MQADGVKVTVGIYDNLLNAFETFEKEHAAQSSDVGPHALLFRFAPAAFSSARNVRPELNESAKNTFFVARPIAIDLAQSVLFSLAHLR